MKIFTKLLEFLPSTYIKPLEKEYYRLNDSYLEQDIVKVGIHVGRLCELFSSLSLYIETSQTENLDKISFDANINKLLKLPKTTHKDEILTHMLPLALRSIYTVRSKKIAHYKTNLPKKLDLKYIKQTFDWVLSQLILLYLPLSDNEVVSFLEFVSRDELQNVQHFENGEILFFDKSISLPNKILYTLHEKIDEVRIKNEELVMVLNPSSKSYLKKSIERLEERNLVQVNSEGIRITKWGIEEAKKIRKKLNDSV